MRKLWTMAALVLLNTVALFAVANLVAALFVADDSADAPVVYDSAWLIDSYGFDVLQRAYPGWDEDDLRVLLTETSNWPQVFEPYTMFRPRPRNDRFITIDPAGFRPTPAQQAETATDWTALWQRRVPADNARDLFVFGGSTVMGAGVADDETIPAHLQTLIDERCALPVRVFNFGRGFYYSTQERILFEKLLLEGARPEVAVFIEGLNDFYFPVDVPRYSDRFAELMDDANSAIVPAGSEAGAFGEAVIAAVEALPLVRLWRRHMPAAIGGARAAVFDASREPDAAAVAVHTRIFQNWRMIRALAKEYSLNPLFVWQPVPTYGYDLDYMNVAKAGKLSFGRHALSGAGYRMMADSRLAARNRLADDVLWLGDMQRSRKENLYVDAVHYTGAFSRDIAEAIFVRLVDTGALDCGKP